MLPGVFGSIPCLQSFCKQERNTLVYQSIFGPVFMRNSNAGDCSLTSGHTGTSVGGSSKVNGTLVRFSATILSQNKGEIVLPLIIFSVSFFTFKNGSLGWAMFARLTGSSARMVARGWGPSRALKMVNISNKKEINTKIQSYILGYFSPVIITNYGTKTSSTP